MFVRSYEEHDTLEIVDADGKFWSQKLVSGDDFYMQPAWHPGGQRIAWIAWNHPNMPWDGTQLHIGKLQVGEGFLPTLIEEKTVAGDVETSIFQPEFSPDGRYLAYVNDETGWWQLYSYDLSSDEVRQVTDAPAEHGHPAWIQGLRTYGFGSDGKTLFFLRNESGFIHLWQIDLSSGKEQRLLLDGGYTFLDQISVREDNLALVASGGRRPPRVITYRPADDGSSGDTHVCRRGTSEELPENAYSKPGAIEWLGMDGRTVHGLYFPPHNASFEGVGTPPLIVRIHGGPTSQTRDKFNPTAQFFTSRGYAVLEVNHRGSTGYGRVYREKLRGNWGVYDVEDSVSGARHLVEGGLVDEKRLTIMGGSAGGFTVLKALEDYPGFFAAGICLYGISNQFTMAADTHKFEAHYSDSLLGTLPETSDLYRERSPIFFVDKIQDPIAIFQGEDDVVVPRLQSDEVVESLQKRGVPHVYHVYAGEGHGFRKSETIEHFYNEVEKFLRQYVIFS
jgi:dipeptidyl aminopeptidase/acylaminoacyl peptidase